MIRSLLARRLVTGVSIVMLLLCQTAAAALACAAPLSPTQAAAVELALCHTYAQKADHNIPVNGCQEGCPDASFETAKVNIPAVGCLALPVLTVALPHAAIPVTAPVDRILACAAPPPLLLVYCRLLI